MPLRQHTNDSNTLYMSNMDVWNGLRWISASTIIIWHHFHSTSNPDFPNLGVTWPVSWYEGATIFLWDSIPIAQTLCICLIWMYGGLRWISASTMMLWHYFNSTSDPEFSAPEPTLPVWQYEGATIFPWVNIPMAQTLCICLIWMYEVVWGWMTGVDYWLRCGWLKSAFTLVLPVQQSP